MADLIEGTSGEPCNQDDQQSQCVCVKVEKFGCPNPLLIVKWGISLNRKEVMKMPDATAAFLEVFKAQLNKRKNMEVKLGEHEEEIAKMTERENSEGEEQDSVPYVQRRYDL